MPHATYLVLFTLLAGALGSGMAAAQPGPAHQLPRVAPNDNLRPAGTPEHGSLIVTLRAAVGEWRPEGSTGPALTVEAFGEVGSALTVPAPLVRVVEGTRILASVRNELDAALTVHGLCAREGAPCPALEVPPGQARAVAFSASRAGTYHYWASTLGAPVPFRELAGALIVDPAGIAVEPDRVLVITEWTSLSREQLGQIMGADDSTEVFAKLRPRLTFVINGLSWPATERLTYRLGEQVRWRVINLSSQAHPMHLHGFFFEVNSLGDGLRDRSFDASRQRRVVTQLLPPGGTMAMTWVPEREGNWLFHCHIMFHVSPSRRLSHPGVDAAGSDPSTAEHEGHGGAAGHSSHGDRSKPSGVSNHGGHDRSGGMAGMIIGVTVLGPRAADAKTRGTGAQTPGSDAPTAGSDHSLRKLTLLMRPGVGPDGQSPVAGFILREGGTPEAAERLAAPGPPIVLRRNQPVEITLVNQLSEATAVHWHGMELESYYDGVHGWSGIGARLAPMIEPGSTFVVRFTPPREGTFIYHTHLHDYRQLSSGLYGPLIVTDDDETFDETTDHVLVIGRKGLSSDFESLVSGPDTVVLNGLRAPRFVWKAGSRHRLRFINITPDDIFAVALQTSEGPVTWTPIAKDGEQLPAADAIPAPARQVIAVGETYEFEFETPPGRRTAWLEVRSPSGRWQAQGQVVIR